MMTRQTLPPPERFPPLSRESVKVRGRCNVRGHLTATNLLLILILFCGVTAQAASPLETMRIATRGNSSISPRSMRALNQASTGRRATFFLLSQPEIREVRQLKGKRIADYYIVMLEDCVGATDLELHQATLKNVNLHFGTVTGSNRVQKLWKGMIDG